jgi:hypothetical protein
METVGKPNPPSDVYIRVVIDLGSSSQSFQRPCSWSSTPLKLPLTILQIVMLVRALTLAALTGAAVASLLRRNNVTQAPSVDLGYEIHTATTNVRSIL